MFPKVQNGLKSIKKKVGEGEFFSFFGQNINPCLKVRKDQGKGLVRKARDGSEGSEFLTKKLKQVKTKRTQGFSLSK